jgi:predicted transcriptional regulator YdeE
LKAATYNINPNKEGFSYLIDVKNITTVCIPKQKFLVFSHCGDEYKSMSSLKKEIMSVWIPASKYEIAPISEIEVFFQGDM